MTFSSYHVHVHLNETSCDIVITVLYQFVLHNLDGLIYKPQQNRAA